MNTFGDFNEFFYEKVFDLLLRLKGNYFWPAMWSASLPLDGSEDPLAILKLGTELGITIGQSHHEPLTRASEEWDKVKSDTNNVGYGKDGGTDIGKYGLYNILIMEEKQTIVALGAGTITKRVYPDGRIERCDNVKDVALYIEKIDEMIERKRGLLS